MIEAFAVATVALDGGGRIGLCRLPGLSGDLDSDVEAIKNWHPAAVISMTQKAEMATLGAADLPARLQALGIVWRHIPIADFGVPDSANSKRWPLIAEALHAALDRGEGVLLHCRGGLGRSGMIALRLMTERGMQADAALAAIRAVRPGAVETEAQRLWSTDYEKPATPLGR
jgi:protein-tyrosine phosphatase